MNKISRSVQVEQQTAASSSMQLSRAVYPSSVSAAPTSEPFLGMNYKI